TVTGGLLSNTLTAAPAPIVRENITSAPGSTFTGNISVTSQRQFTISGYVYTSHGLMQTTLEQSIRYLNTQQFNVSPSTDIQNVQQSTILDSRVITLGSEGENTLEQHFSYPLSVNFSFITNADGSSTQSTSIQQQDLERVGQGGETVSTLRNEVRSADTL